MTSFEAVLSAGKHTFVVEDEGRPMTLAYFVHRSGEPTQPMKPLLVMQPPGWGIGAAYMQVSMTALEEHFTLLYLVTRGSEPSGRPVHGDRMGPWNMADDLESLRIHLGLERLPAVLGHSNGGSIALAYAEKYPLGLDRLILVDHQLIGNKRAESDPDLWEERKHDSRYEEALSFMGKRQDAIAADETYLQWLKDIGPIYFSDPERYVHVFRDALADGPISTWCAKHQGSGDMRLADPPVLIDRMPDVQAKTLVMFGKDDMMCPIRHAHRTKQGIPHAKVVLYDSCGHFPWIEQPEATLRDIIEFMSS